MNDYQHLIQHCVPRTYEVLIDWYLHTYYPARQIKSWLNHMKILSHIWVPKILTTNKLSSFIHSNKFIDQKPRTLIDKNKVATYAVNSAAESQEGKLMGTILLFRGNHVLFFPKPHCRAACVYPLIHIDTNVSLFTITTFTAEICDNRTIEV
jgi:hypothetical protein